MGRRWQRLRQAREFGRVFRHGKSVGDRYFVFFVLPSATSSASLPRIGFATARAAGSAVKRNRIRRRMRALAAQLDVAPGWSGDIVVLGKARVLEASWTELQRSFGRLLKKACEQSSGGSGGGTGSS